MIPDSGMKACRATSSQDCFEEPCGNPYTLSPRPCFFQCRAWAALSPLPAV